MAQRPLPPIVIEDSEEDDASLGWRRSGLIDDPIEEIEDSPRPRVRRARVANATFRSGFVPIVAPPPVAAPPLQPRLVRNTFDVYLAGPDGAPPPLPQRLAAGLRPLIARIDEQLAEVGWRRPPPGHGEDDFVSMLDVAAAMATERGRTSFDVATAFLKRIYPQSYLPWFLRPARPLVGRADAEVFAVPTGGGAECTTWAAARLYAQFDTVQIHGPPRDGSDFPIMMEAETAKELIVRDVDFGGVDMAIVPRTRGTLMMHNVRGLGPHYALEASAVFLDRRCMPAFASPTFQPPAPPAGRPMQTRLQRCILSLDNRRAAETFAAQWADRVRLPRYSAFFFHFSAPTSGLLPLYNGLLATNALRKHVLLRGDGLNEWSLVLVSTEAAPMAEHRLEARPQVQQLNVHLVPREEQFLAFRGFLPHEAAQYAGREPMGPGTTPAVMRLGASTIPALRRCLPHSPSAVCFVEGIESGLETCRHLDLRPHITEKEGAVVPLRCVQTLVLGALYLAPHVHVLELLCNGRCAAAVSTVTHTIVVRGAGRVHLLLDADAKPRVRSDGSVEEIVFVYTHRSG